MATNTMVKQKLIACLYTNDSQNIVIIKGDFIGSERILQPGEQHRFITHEDAYLEIVYLSRQFPDRDKIPCSELIEQ